MKLVSVAGYNGTRDDGPEAVGRAGAASNLACGEGLSEKRHFVYMTGEYRRRLDMSDTAVASQRLPFTVLS